MRHLILAGAGLLALSVLAPTMPAGAEAIPAPTLDARLAGLTIDEIEDMDVVDRTGREIGEIEEVLRGPAGLVAEIEIDDREVAVPLDHLALTEQGRIFLRSMSAEDVQRLPKASRDGMAEVEDDDMTVAQVLGVR
jgi:hypothetical protein